MGLAFVCKPENAPGGGSQIHLLFFMVKCSFSMVNCHYAKIIM